MACVYWNAAYLIWRRPLRKSRERLCSFSGLSSAHGVVIEELNILGASTDNSHTSLLAWRMVSLSSLAMCWRRLLTFVESLQQRRDNLAYLVEQGL